MLKSAVGKKLKSLRYERNLTLKQVSEGTGISVSMLSKIERDETTPTIDLVIKLSTFFNLSLAEMVNIPQDRRVSKTSHDNLLSMDSNGGLSVQFFNRYSPDVSVDFFKITIPQNASMVEDSVHPAGSFHVLYCDGGKGVMTINEEEIPLVKGDVVSFYSDVPHNYKNNGDEDLIIIGILTYK